jgi:ribosome-associated heat shock protein Hsp15
MIVGKYDALRALRSKVYQSIPPASSRKPGKIVTLRIDKWLYFTRFYKTRGMAAKAVRGGHVKINGSRAKPASAVSPGDIIELVRDQLPWRLEAGELPSRRGPATEARACYTEAEDVAAIRSELAAGRRMDRLQMPRTPGRPDKHTRRKLRERRRR